MDGIVKDVITEMALSNYFHQQAYWGRVEKKGNINIGLGLL